MFSRLRGGAASLGAQVLLFGCGARGVDADAALGSTATASASTARPELPPDQPRRDGTRRDVTDVTMHAGSGCVVLGDRRVACWGRGPNGLTAHPTLVDGVLDATSAVLQGGGELHVLHASGAVSVVRSGKTTTTTGTPASSLRVGPTASCTLDAAGAVSCARRGESRIPSGRLDLEGPVVDLQIGDDHLCAARADGHAVCVGANTSGQLGAHPQAEMSEGEVFTVTNLDDVVGISTGARHTCALRGAGDVRCWGSPSHVIGLGWSTQRAPAGAQAVPGVSGAVSIASGERTTCAVDAKGGAWCWGDNTHGQLGASVVGEHQGGPARVAGVDSIRRIAPGDETCAVSAGQRLYCWGNVVRFAPVKVFGVERASDVGAGGDRSCAVTGVDRVFCWGGNVVEASPTLTPLPVDVRGTRVAVSGGKFDGCAVTAGGHVDCWRRDQHTVPGVEDAVSVANGALHACALRRSGAVACWGENPSGELGFPTDRDEHPARDVPDIHDATALSSGSSATCVIRGRGRVECWGAQNATRGEPMVGRVVVPDLDDAVQVALGDFQTCVRRRTGRVACWGYTGFRAEDGPPESHPIDLPIDDAIDLAVGPRFACAVRATGRVACWGELTDATRGGSDAGAPGTLVYEVQDLANASRVAVGRRHACAMTISGSVYCWGENTAGQIGDRSGPGVPTEREIRLP